MNARLSLAEVRTALPNAYKSLDIRTAKVLTGDTWKNVCTVIRFSWLSAEELEEHFESLSTKFGAVKGSLFAIELNCKPVRDFECLNTQLAEGELVLGNSTLEVGFSLNMNEQLGNLRNNHNFLLEDGIWPSFETQIGWLANSGENPHYRMHADDVVKEASRAGHSSPKEVMHDLMEIHPNMRGHDLGVF